MIKDTRYIIKRVIIGVLVSLLLSFIYACDVKAETLQCDAKLKLNGSYVTTLSTTQLSANTNYTLQMVEPGVIGNDVYVDGNYYTDYLVVTNIAFGNYTGTNNGNAFQLLNTNTKSNALGFGTNDGVWRIRVLWTAQDTIDREDGRILAYAYTTTNWGGSVNYLGGMRLINVTCGEQANMPTNGESDSAVLKAFSDLQSSINSQNNTINNQTTIISGDLNDIENAINGGNATNRQYQQATTDAVNGVNDTLNNSNVSINSLPSDNVNMGPISSLVTLPVTALNNIVSAFSGTCTPFNIGSLFGTNLVFPCINIESFIGSFLWNTIDIIVTGIFIFSIRQRFVDLFYKLVTLKDIGLKGGF